MEKAIKKILMTTFVVSMPCPKKKCKGELMWYQYAGLSDGKNHYDHKCSKCQYQRCIDRKYPHQITKT